MSTADAFEPYRESLLGKPVSNVKNPGPFSAENLILFTVEANLMGGIGYEEARYFVEQCRVEAGVYIRYPGMTDKWCSHDDLTAICVRFPDLAYEVYEYGEKHGWSWPGVGYLGRIIDFPATVKAAAGVKLTVHDQVFAAAGFLGDAFIRTTNQFNGKPDVGGTCLLYLKQKALSGKSRFVDAAIWIWRMRMEKLFGTMANVYGVYFGEVSPWAVYGPKEFR